MPKINRIRIANVSYDGKYISDEIFETFGGENTLFNLANGSGKSVLVQMMMQPILPKRKMQDRSVESYLSKTSSPTYVMLEWKLDYTVKPVYFLTGIAMCSIGQGDETGAKVKYFTFTHRYSSASEYDIANSPLISHTDGGCKYMLYNDAYNLLRNVKDDIKPLVCFHEDKKKDYIKSLEEHGIFEKEWKLLAKVNNKEGGVDEMFAGCKSSTALLDEWIIRAITDSEGTERRDLSEMLLSLMSSILDQEDVIEERELLTSFLYGVEGLVDSLSALNNSLDELEKIEKLLSGLHYHLLKEAETVSDQILSCDESARQLNAELLQIQYEKLSEAWHIANEECQRCKATLEEARDLTATHDRQYASAKLARETMEASGHMKDFTSAKAHIEALRQQLMRAKDITADQESRDILFTLDKQLSDEITRTNAELKSMADQESDLRNTLFALKSAQEQINKEKNDISGMLATSETKQTAFREFETNCQKTLGFSIRRTLTGELSPDEVDSARKSLDDEFRHLSDLGQKLNDKMQAARDRRKYLLDGQKELYDMSATLSSQIDEKKREFDAFLKYEAALGVIADRWRFAPTIDSIPSNLNSLKDNETLRKSELAKFETQLVYHRDTLTRFDANSLHSAPEYGALLDAWHIPYTTGEEYLKDLDAHSQKAALANNPMLPYCFLVAKQDFEKATSLHTSNGIDRVCPVLVLENAHDELRAGEFSVEFTGLGRALCYYYEDSFAPDTRATYRDGLAFAITTIEQQCAQWRGELKLYRTDIDFLEAFPYNSDSKGLLKADLKALEEQRAALIERIDCEKREAEELESMCDRLHCDIRDNQQDKENAQANIALFSNYLSQDEEYQSELKEHQSLTKQNEKLIKRYDTLADEVDGTNSKLESTLIEKSSMRGTLDSMVKKQAGFVAPESGTLLDWSLEALEKRYEEIMSKQSSDERRILSDISHQEENKQKAEKSLKKFGHIEPGEIERVTYDEERLELLYKEESRVERVLNTAKEKQGSAENQFIRADATVNNCSENLRNEGWDTPLPPGGIKGDFDGRRRLINENLGGLKESTAALKKEHDNYQRDINRIFSVIKNPVPKELLAPEGGWSSVDITAQSEKHSNAVSKLRILHNSAIENERELKTSFTGLHAGIDNILGTLHISESELTFDACYYAYERLVEQRLLLLDSVQVLTSDLEHLDAKKQNIVHQAFLHGKWLHGELRKISASSYVRLAQDRPRQQTLKIGVPDELDSFANERMSNHVEACIADMRKKKKDSGLSDKDMRGIISARLSDREILNQVIGQATIDVKLLKVDASHAYTKLRTWESVQTDNSGGELFVSCFALLSALMDYSRKSILPDGSQENSTKVMLIDNPFGTTSSEHLLNALVKVAEQFNMQMICLSDLSQSSITAKFTLIYQLSLRPAMYSDRSYLKIDAVKQNADVSRDSRLEHVSLRQEQLRMF